MSNDDEVRDTDPSGRYIRFDDELGRGAYKVVYRAIDRDRGIEVAWNQIRVDQQADFEKLWKEITILQSLSHPNILVCHAAWVDEKQLHVAFITECMTSGTIRQFMKKAKSVKLKVLKGWCTQILSGLDYLHTREPPIIHRDIKCDNILINGTSGVVKIGDLGLATNILNYTGTKLSIIGTPEFMAPEYYEEVYDEKVDIWAFGMCLLEMATLEYPFSECTNPAQIFKKVSSGQKPRSLLKLKDADILQFLDECLAPAAGRKSAADLLKHPFLQNLDDDRSLGLRTDEEVDELVRQGITTPQAAAAAAAAVSSPTAPLSPPDARKGNISIPPHLNGINTPNNGVSPGTSLSAAPTFTSSSPPPMSSAPIAIPSRREGTNHMEYTTASLTAPGTMRSEVSTMSSSIGDSGSHTDSPHMSMTNPLVPDPGSVTHSLQAPMSPPQLHGGSSSTASSSSSGGQLHLSLQQQLHSGLHSSSSTTASTSTTGPQSPHQQQHLHQGHHQVATVIHQTPVSLPTTANNVLSSPPQHLQHQQTPMIVTPPASSAPPSMQQQQQQQQHQVEPAISHIPSPAVAYDSAIPPVHLGPNLGDMLITVLNSPQSNTDMMIVSLRLAFGAIGTLEFDFRIDTDTAMSVAREMSDEFGLSPTLLPIIAKYISDKVSEYTHIIHPQLQISRAPLLDIPLFQQRSDNLLSAPQISPRQGSSPRRFVSNMSLDKSALSQLSGSRDIPLDRSLGSSNGSPVTAGSPISASLAAQQQAQMQGHIFAGQQHRGEQHIMSPFQPAQHPALLATAAATGHRPYRLSAPLDNDLEAFDDMSIPSPRRRDPTAVLKRSFSSALPNEQQIANMASANNASGGAGFPPQHSPRSHSFQGQAGGIGGIVPPPSVVAPAAPEQHHPPHYDWPPAVGMHSDPISRNRNRSASAAPPRRPVVPPRPDLTGATPIPTTPQRGFDDFALRTSQSWERSPEFGGIHRPASMQIDPRATHFGSIIQDLSTDMHHNSLNFENALRDFETTDHGHQGLAQGSIALDSVGFGHDHDHHDSDSDSGSDEMHDHDDDEHYHHHHQHHHHHHSDDGHDHPTAAMRSSPIGISTGSPFPAVPSHTSPIVAASVERVMSMSTPFGEVMIAAPVSPSFNNTISSPPANRASISLSSSIPSQPFADHSPFGAN